MEESPEKVNETIGLQQHAQDRPPEQDDSYASQKETGSLKSLPLEEETKSSSYSNDNSQTRQEQDLRTRTTIWRC